MDSRNIDRKLKDLIKMLRLYSPEISTCWLLMNGARSHAMVVILITKIE
jgi:hypothetical protein